METSSYDLKPAIITNGVKLAMTFIDRVGFPILAFLLMWFQNRELQKTIQTINDTIIAQSAKNDIQAEILRRIEMRLK